MARVDYQLAHLIHIDPKAAKKEILDVLRGQKMHMTNAAAAIGCTHGTLLGWIARLDAIEGIGMTEAITALKAKAEKEGWHWVNHGNPNSKGRPPLTEAEKKRRAKERAAATAAHATKRKAQSAKRTAAASAVDRRRVKLATKAA